VHPSAGFPQTYTVTSVTDIHDLRSVRILIVDTEEKICRRYEAIFAWIESLDRAYYLNKAPTGEDRAEYFARQLKREAVRNQFYSELAAIRCGLPAARPN